MEYKSTFLQKHQKSSDKKFSEETLCLIGVFSCCQQKAMRLVAKNMKQETRHVHRKT